MGSITDFNDYHHRVESSSATFQKGLYHLFMLNKHPEADVYATVIRTYQCLFQLAVTQWLLDETQELSTKGMPVKLKQVCANAKLPIRKELDPAAIVTHGALENWQGFQSTHPLGVAGNKSIQLYKRVIEARHNLLYRPFLLDGNYWEDCTLIDLLDQQPTAQEVEDAYRAFIDAAFHWTSVESPPFFARYFVQLLFYIYEDQRDNRPTETILLTYARLLLKDNGDLLKEVRAYRNQLVDLENPDRMSVLNGLEDWHPGEV